MVLSKGFAAGYVPLRAMAATPAAGRAPVLDAGGFLHGYTYAGNPLACAAGLAVIEEIETQRLVANAEAMGGVLDGAAAGASCSAGRSSATWRGKGLLTASELGRRARRQ